MSSVYSGCGTSMRRDRPFDGQPHTDTGVRGATEITGVTFRDLHDCFIRAVLLSTGAGEIDEVDMRPRYAQATRGELAELGEGDLYGFDLDQLGPMAICQNLCCEVERVMGIFPNVPSLMAEGVLPISRHDRDDLFVALGQRV